MKNNRITILGISAMVLGVLCGFTANYHNLSKQENQLASELICNLSDNYQDIHSSTRTDADKDFCVDCEKYTDGEYSYYVDLHNEYVVAIHPILCDFSYEDANINTADIIQKAESLTKNNHILNSKLKYSSRLFYNEGVGFTVELIEKFNDFESGTRSSISFDCQGKLVCAAFIKGDNTVLEKIENTPMISETDAINRAVSEFNQEFDKIVIKESDAVNVSMKTKNSTVSYYIEFSIQDGSGTRAYWISIDAFDGSLIEIEYEL